jgi:hypothetical protein
MLSCTGSSQAMSARQTTARTTHHAPRTPGTCFTARLQTLLVSASLRRVEIVRRQSLLIPSFVIMYKAAQGYLDTTLPTALILLGP